jgi:dynein heavy chain
LFNQPETPYEELDKLDKEFKPFYDLIIMAYEVEDNFKNWRGNQLMRLGDTNEIAASVASWTQQCFQLNKKLSDDYPETADAAVELRGTIDVFSKNLPLIKCFTSEAITDEDWKEIVDVVGLETFERDEIRISQFTELDLFRFVDDIEEITMKAEKKYSLAQKLKAMKEDMKKFELKLADYKGISFLIKGYDDINAQLDDQIVATQAMLGSSFMRGRLKNETRAYEKKLNDMSELMEEILKVQRTWMYLEPIFGSGDIMNTMPLEGKMFTEVDTTWKNTMNGINEEPGIVDLAEKENIINQFLEANRKLDKIQKSLSDYLEQKRLIFARFFFLANEDLLQILAQTKNPRLVQAHMDKCFEGISKVIFNDDDNVLGMRSAEQEIVDFNKKIDVNEGDKKGNVEMWMLDIEA